MKITFEGPAVLVSDMDRSRAFYENVLGQEVLADHGPHVAYQGGFFLWQADHAAPMMLGQGKKRPDRLDGDNFELYFETGELDAAWDAAEAAGAGVVHPVVEQPWGQRGFRVKDPDGHVVEVAEPLSVLVARLVSQGLGLEEIHQKTFIPLEMIREIVRTMSERA